MFAIYAIYATFFVFGLLTGVAGGVGFMVLFNLSNRIPKKKRGNPIREC